MKIFKPDSLALLYRSMRLGGQNTLVLGMMAMFHFERSNREELLSEAELWKRASAALGADAILDNGMPKPAGEFLVYGACHAPQGTTVPQLFVSVTVGAGSKRLAVFGDRHFGALKSASAPQPFSSMRIDPEHAFGGPGYADNPVGKGYAGAGSAGNGSRVALPNVELPKHLIALEGDTAPPAGFWAWTQQSVQRSRHLGGTGAKWLNDTWPHLPEDTAPAFFHAAPEDQRLGTYLRGDESIEITNMHPRKAHLAGVLPKLRARCLVHRTTREGKVISELNARAETLWLFPEIECGIVLYRASVRIDDEDAEDVLHVMAEWESMNDAPLSFEHYREAFQREIDGKGAAAAFAPAEQNPPAAAPIAEAAPAPATAIGTAALAASAAAAPLDTTLDALQKTTAGLEQQVRDLMSKFGITEAELSPKKAEIFLPADKEIESIVADLEAQAKQLMDKHGIVEADFAKKTAVLSEPDLFTELEKAQATHQQMIKASGLTEFDIERAVAANPELADLKQLFKQPDLDVAQLRREYDALTASAASAAAMAVPAVTALTQMAPAPSSLPIDLPQQQQPQEKMAVKYADRAGVIDAHRRGLSFAGDDLSGIDLSGLDFGGVDFSGALLEKTNFNGAKLTNTYFDRALLQGADFSGADLSAASLAGASAGSASFARARMEASDISGTDFTAADFTQAQLSHAIMTGATFDGARMAGLKALSCRAGKAGFSGCDLSNADFGGAHLLAARFSAAQCVGANMRDAICDKAEFDGADCSAAIFAGASLQASRADQGSRFDAAVFSRAQMSHASWEGVSIVKARFDQAVLDHADFSRVQAQEALFNRASAKGAKFSKADLSRADLSAINLFKGALRKTKIDGALMRNANFYGVDFEGTQPTIASLEGSNIDQTILKIRQPVI